MKPSLFWNTIRRESRGSRGRLVFFTLCVALGVAAIVSVSSLLSAFEEGLRFRSREVLAGDLLVSSRQPLPETLDATLERARVATGLPPLTRSDHRELPTLASFDRDGERKSRLVMLKAVDAQYPLAGELVLRSGDAFRPKLEGFGAVVASELLAELQCEVGDSIVIGGQSFEIRDVVESEPDRLQISFSAGPRVFIAIEDLEALSLLKFGSRVRYRALFAGDSIPVPQLHELRDALQEELPDVEYLEIQTHDEAQPALREGIDRVERYLGLVALVSLLLGCAGIAQIVSTWINGRQDEIAILRCLGFRPRDVSVIFLSAVLLLATIGSAIGALVGGAVPFVLPTWVPGLVPPELVDPWQPGPPLRGLLMGVGVAFVFGLPPLLSIWRVSPLRALRQGVEPLRISWLYRGVASVMLLGGITLASYVQARDVELALTFTGSILGLALVLVLVARAVVWIARRVPRQRLSPYVRHGIAALGRPAAGTTTAIAALGLGVAIVLGLDLVERRIIDDLRATLPPDAPSAYLWDVQPDQWAEVETILKEHAGVESYKAVPIAMARLRAVDDKPVRELLEGVDPDDRQHWVLTREQRLTWFDELDESNTIVEGEWWSDEIPNEVSVEIEFARDLGAEVGSILTFDIQGTPVELRVSSLREVEWRSFSINFFLVVEPGPLEAAPHFQMVGVRAEPASEDALQAELTRAVPNIVVIRVREIIERVVQIMTQLSLGVQILGGVTIVLALLMLAGSIGATSLDRGREVALLKTLGVTRRGVVGLFTIEYAITGLVGGAIGAVAAVVGSTVFLERSLDLPVELDVMAPVVTTLACAVFAVGCGLAASLRPLRQRPLAALR